MKRDPDLVREILFAIEKDENATGHGWIDLRIENHSLEEVSYHVQLLDEAGLIRGTDLSTQTSYQWRPDRLTWYGHEFLDSVRDKSVWERAKKELEKTGNFSFEILMKVLTNLATASLTTN